MARITFWRDVRLLVPTTKELKVTRPKHTESRWLDPKKRNEKKRKEKRKKRKREKEKKGKKKKKQRKQEYCVREGYGPTSNMYL